MPRAELAIAIPQTFSGQTVRPALSATISSARKPSVSTARGSSSHTLGAMPSLAPVELLAFAAAITTRMRLGAEHLERIASALAPPAVDPRRSLDGPFVPPAGNGLRRPKGEGRWPERSTESSCSI
jgi:hypothetical protein